MRQKCEKNAKTCEKVAQDLPKRCPTRWSQTLGFFQVASKRRPSCVQEVQEAPKTPQERPKSVPRAAKNAPKPPKSARKAAKSDPRVTEICPRDAQCASRGTFCCAFLCFLSFCSIFLGRLLHFSAAAFFSQVCELTSRDTGFGGELPIVG